jgi:tRNA A-37 threonylcarbamoyl transferase component Bud32
MAVVYKAQDEALKREVAVKVLHAHLLAEPESKTRLEREAQAVAKLHHDNIVQIFDYSGIDSAASYIVTEFIDGQTLKQFMANRKPPPPEVAALIALEIASALVHAHSLGIIHRDVKPDNVMVRKDGILKLMDFGVAQIMDLERMTVTGQLLGSPAYMAPEILEGKPLDVRTDVFSVGIMLYQLATGALPFSGRNPHEVLKRIAEGKFADPRTLNRLISDRLAKIIAKALARKPEERYPTVAALLDDLQDFVGDAGLMSTREELRGFFSDPNGYTIAVVPRMVEALVKSGKREREARRTARALALWNRALAMDPTNRDVMGELRRLEARQHVQRGGIIAAALVVLGVGGMMIFKHASVLPPAPGPGAATAGPVAARPGSPPSTPGTKAPVAAPRPAGPSAPTTAAPAVKVAAARLPGTRARKVEKKTIILTPWPRRMDLQVDGEARPTIGPTTNTLELDWTRTHTLVFSSVCCSPKTVLIGPDQEDVLESTPKGDRLRVVLQGRPAILKVNADPPAKGTVYVREVDRGEDEQGKPVQISGLLGEDILISFVGDRDMLKQLELTIDIEGRDPTNHTVEIRAGDKKTEIVKLGN